MPELKVMKAANAHNSNKRFSKASMRKFSSGPALCIESDMVCTVRCDALRSMFRPSLLLHAVLLSHSNRLVLTVQLQPG